MKKRRTRNGNGKARKGRNGRKKNGGMKVPVVGSQAMTPAYKYSKTKTTAVGYQQEEYKNPRGGESLYKEHMQDEPAGKTYKGESGGWELGPAARAKKVSKALST